MLGSLDRAEGDVRRGLRAVGRLASALLTLFMLPPVSCVGQSVPSHIPDMQYPPIAKLAHVEGDVAVRFEQMPDGSVSAVTAVSGPPMLQGTAVANVKAWRFSAQTKGAVREVTFHFSLEPPDGRYDDDGQATRVELSDDSILKVLGRRTSGLSRSDCPAASERFVPGPIMKGNFIELDRWNEIVRVDADGAVAWGENSKDLKPRGRISEAEASRLLEKFEVQAALDLCGRYEQTGLMDGGGSEFKVRVGGREKNVSEYGDSAPPLFEELELAVDEAVDTHQWRHGDPVTESIIEIGDETYLPKLGKTRLMQSLAKGDEAAIRAALVAGDKVTDVDSSGWTPLMYAAGSYSSTGESELRGRGSDVNARSKRGETALMAAAAKGDADEGLIEAGAEVNAVNEGGMTALMLLVQRGEASQIETMIKAGADVRKRDKEGRTALDYLNAANCGRPIVEAKAPQWKSAGHFVCNALQDKYEEAKQLLVSAGAVATRTWTPKPLPLEGESANKANTEILAAPE
jgi:TonB family protein